MGMATHDIPTCPFINRRAQYPARGAKRRRRYITADRINHALFREVAPSRAGPRCANSPQNQAARCAARVTWSATDACFADGERDDGARAARSDTSVRYSRVVYHGGRGYIGEEGWGRATTGSAASLWLLCALPPGNRTVQGPFSRRPREFASRPRRDATPP